MLRLGSSDLYTPLQREQAWAIEQIYPELDTIRNLLAECRKMLRQRVTLPVSSARSQQVKGILHRKDATVDLTIEAKLGGFEFTVSEKDLPLSQISHAIAALEAADDSLAHSAGASLTRIQWICSSSYRALQAARESLRKASSLYTDLVIHPASGAPESAKLQLYVDSQDIVIGISIGSKMDEKVKTRSPDPAFLTVFAKLGVAEKRVLHISRKIPLNYN